MIKKKKNKGRKPVKSVYLFIIFLHEQASHAQNADQQTLHEIIHTENYMTWENYQFFTREAAVLLESFLDNLPDYSINIPIYLFTYLCLDDVALALLESCFHSAVARIVKSSTVSISRRVFGEMHPSSAAAAGGLGSHLTWVSSRCRLHTDPLPRDLLTTGDNTCNNTYKLEGTPVFLSLSLVHAHAHVHKHSQCFYPHVCLFSYNNL